MLWIYYAFCLFDKICPYNSFKDTYILSSVCALELGSFLRRDPDSFGGLENGRWHLWPLFAYPIGHPYDLVGQKIKFQRHQTPNTRDIMMRNLIKVGSPILRIAQ